MKKIIYLAVFTAALFASCRKQDLETNQKELIYNTTGEVDTLKGDVTVNTTLTRTTYLKGIVFVKPGVTLTVNPGVTVKGSFGTVSRIDADHLESAKGTLVIERNAKLVAEGTSSQPIIWTSERPAGARDFGDWGGIVICGNAYTVTATEATTNNFSVFEGFIPNTGGRFTYGNVTRNTNDNSGSISYNRIEFAGGIVIGSEIRTHGLSLCGVGDKTLIHHVEVSNSGGDGFAFFGGTVNADHLLSYGNKDDDFDFNEAYTGKLQFIVAYRSDLADHTGSKLIEVDNNNNSTYGDFGGKANTRPFISNATLIGPVSLTPRATDLAGKPIKSPRFDEAVHVRRFGTIRLLNSIVSTQAFPATFVTTPSTDAFFFHEPDIRWDNTSAVINNLFEPATSAQKTRKAKFEGDLAFTAHTAPIYNLPLEQQFIKYGTKYFKNFASFQLGTHLEPLTGSPALSGGLDLSEYGFVSTFERGAVRSTDVWTTAGWISTLLH